MYCYFLNVYLSNHFTTDGLLEPCRFKGFAAVELVVLPVEEGQ